ncbi:hypothetical protein [Alicyclobacillus herbarius]|uniref:hypothetical protein n=1 Tax=Alicyclobacillus herbarius TaxID=122960 RepID=UPI0003F641DF|nr:hypothetical protein [Alicyclobacillus herbarius]
MTNVAQLHKDAQHRRTKREAVWDYLRSHQGQWIDAHILTHPAIGGSEGLRRLREIRASLPLDWRIEKRRKRGQDGFTHTWQYRLVRVHTP